MGPTEIFRLRVDDVAESSVFEFLPCPGFWNWGGPSTALILEAVVVAVATDCRGRELRREGDSFGAGTADTYAFKRPLLGVVIFDGGGFRLEPDGLELCVLDKLLGVMDRVVGVFARAASDPCCLDVLPLAGPYFAAAGELGRVESLLGFEELLILFIIIGRREVGDVGGVGEAGDAGARSVCCLRSV